MSDLLSDIWAVLRIPERIERVAAIARLAPEPQPVPPRWTRTSCLRCGYERADCTCIGGFVPPAPQRAPTIDELMALPVIARDYLGDLAPNSTALRIAMHAQHYAEIAVETWEDQNERRGVIPAATVLALVTALDAMAWRHIYSQQDADHD